MTESIGRTDGSEPAADGLEPSEAMETAEIRADIEATRDEMTGTLGAIGDRLDPNRLMSQAKDTVRDATIGKVEEAVANAGETARGAGITMLETIKQNPIPAAMAGIGLYWLWQSRSASQGGGQRRDLGGYGYAAHGTNGNAHSSSAHGGSSPIDAAGNAVGQARDTAGQVVGTVGHSVGQVAGTVGSTAGQVAGNVQGAATQVVWQAQGVVQHTSGQVRRMMSENPLALGAVATGVGVAVGLLVPETPQEHRLMGEAGDTVAEKAQEVVSETMDKVREVSDRAQSAVMEQAEEHGLTPAGVGGPATGDTTMNGGGESTDRF